MSNTTVYDLAETWIERKQIGAVEIDYSCSK